MHPTLIPHTTHTHNTHSRSPPMAMHRGTPLLLLALLLVALAQGFLLRPSTIIRTSTTTMMAAHQQPHSQAAGLDRKAALQRGALLTSAFLFVTGASPLPAFAKQPNRALRRTNTNLPQRHHKMLIHPPPRPHAHMTGLRRLTPRSRKRRRRSQDEQGRRPREQQHIHLALSCLPSFFLSPAPWLRPRPSAASPTSMMLRLATTTTDKGIP